MPSQRKRDGQKRAVLTSLAQVLLDDAIQLTVLAREWSPEKPTVDPLHQALAASLCKTCLECLDSDDKATKELQSLISSCLAILEFFPLESVDLVNEVLALPESRTSNHVSFRALQILLVARPEIATVRRILELQLTAHDRLIRNALLCDMVEGDGRHIKLSAVDVEALCLELAHIVRGSRRKEFGATFRRLVLARTQ